MPLTRAIDWTFVAGFGLIGPMILTHLILCVRRGCFFARGSTTCRGTQPGFVRFLMILETVVLAILVGGSALYLRAGGRIAAPAARSRKAVIRL